MGIAIEDQLNILGNQADTFGFGLLSIAAAKESEAKITTNEEQKNLLSGDAEKLHLLGIWVVLLGDSLLALATQLDAEKKRSSIIGNPVLQKATELNLFTAWNQIVIDVLAIEAFELERSSEK